MYLLLMYLPPTPTAMPVAPLSPITIDPAIYRIWSFTDEAIMIWNESNRWSVGVLIQIVILLAMLIAFIFIAIKWINSFSDGDA